MKRKRAKRLNDPDPKPAMMIAGLGNPGAAYAVTRHNMGFQVVEALAREAAIRLQPLDSACIGRGMVGGQDVLLVKPMVYMNCSGPPVKAALERYRLSGRALMVIHDDIDLAFGKLKFKEKGGDGGHNGIRSIMDALGTMDFMRLRIGIGRPAAGDSVIDHVLGRFSAESLPEVAAVVTRACAAVIACLTDGIEAAMNRYHAEWVAE